MLSYNELKAGVVFVYENQPYQVLSSAFLRKQQRKPVVQTEIKSLITGKTLQRNFHMNESFKEADIEKQKIKYLYTNKGEYWFCEINNPGNRFSLTEDVVGEASKFAKENSEVISLNWNEKPISIIWPIKTELKVKEAPPSEKGNTVQGGSKQAILETGAKVNVPMFINIGDIVRINTQSGEYVERVEKA